MNEYPGQIFMSEDVEFYTWWTDLKDPRLPYFIHILKVNLTLDINICRGPFREKIKEKKSAECNMAQRVKENIQGAMFCKHRKTFRNIYNDDGNGLLQNNNTFVE